MFTKNYTIISLYSSVFIVIGLLTAYFPLWLNQALKLETHHIGYILSLSGVLKVIFTLTITAFIKNGNYLRASLIFITAFTATLFLVIYYFKSALPFSLIFFMVILFLISFSPVLPFIETFYSSLVKKSFENYGKIRISGSISFCIAVFLFGFFFSKFSLTIFPVVLVISLLMIGFSVFMIPSTVGIQKYKNLESYKTFFKKKNKNLVIIVLACSLLQSTHAMYYAYSTIMWENKGLDFFKVGMLWSFAIAAEILFFLIIDKNFKSNLIYKTLIFCSIASFIRWGLTYLVENFYILLIVQTLHGITFALTHYTMIFSINTKLKQSSKLLVQSVYFTLNGGIFITILTIACGHLTSYTKEDEGYLLMSLIAFLSLILVYKNRKILK